jgi:MGT family glycosyltransferase
LVAPLWQEAGVEPDEFAGAYRGAYVDICPPALRVPTLSEPSAAHFLRPVAAVTQENGARKRPLVYATLGTRYNDPGVFRVLLDALGMVDCDAVMTIGRDRSPDDLEPIAENVTVAQYIPQDGVLADCDAVASHGGSGSFLAALAYGRPLVLLPQGADQLDNAAACASLGVAEVVLPPEQGPDRVRRAVELVLHEPAYTAAAKRIAGEIAAMPPPAVVADELLSQR